MHSNTMKTQVVDGLVWIARKPHWLRQLLRRHVVFHRLFSHVLPHYQQYGVRDDTQVVIEGFPRCANTFAYVAFRMSQPEQTRIAHHLHSLGQVKRAVRSSIPTLVLIREPKAAVLSLAIRRETPDVERPLVEYVEYYEGIAKMAHDVVIADFKEVTTDYGAVIRRLNDRFDTSFTEFQHTPETLEEAYRLVDEQELAQSGANQTRSTHVARPTEEREARKAALLSLFETDRARRLLTGAERVYEQLIDMNPIDVARGTV